MPLSKLFGPFRAVVVWSTDSPGRCPGLFCGCPFGATHRGKPTSKMARWVGIPQKGSPTPKRSRYARAVVVVQPAQAPDEA